MRAQDRSKWHQLVETAMLMMGALLNDDDIRGGRDDFCYGYSFRQILTDFQILSPAELAMIV